VRGKIRARLLVATSLLVSSSVYASLWLFGVGGRWSAPVVAVLAGAVVGAAVGELSVRWFDDTVRPLTDAARRMYEGDLTVRARVDREQDVGKLGAAFDQLAGSLSRTVGELRSERDLVSRILDGCRRGCSCSTRTGRSRS
jgi:methyl-accepting chemotaxis protein